MCKNSIHTTGAAASAVNELCTDRGSVCVTNSESTHDEPLYCRISTQKAIYKIPYQDILFIESEQKKICHSSVEKNHLCFGSVISYSGSAAQGNLCADTSLLYCQSEKCILHR